MLAPLAERLAADGHRVITYDRRGTGGSGRDAWPGSGARQHADDAAALLRALHAEGADVLGLSSGGVIALDLAVRHPTVVRKTFVWEAPAVGVVRGGEALNAQITAPIERHLAAHPGDYVGAQAIVLSAILGSRVTVDDPRFAAARANAEPMIRDEPKTTLRTFSARELADLDVTIGVGTAPNNIVAAAARRLGQLTGRRPLVVDTDEHEVYLSDPSVLADVLGDER
jgi:pimeloyl-ACP methyl ester carboxylesterase